jgi:hypothetical protein
MVQITVLKFEFFRPEIKLIHVLDFELKPCYFSNSRGFVKRIKINV